jgi:hypothetical protein
LFYNTKISDNNAESRKVPRMLVAYVATNVVFLLLKTIFPPDRFFKFMMQFSASAKNALVICRRNIHL